MGASVRMVLLALGVLATTTGVGCALDGERSVAEQSAAITSCHSLALDFVINTGTGTAVIDGTSHDTVGILESLTLTALGNGVIRADFTIVFSSDAGVVTATGSINIHGTAGNGVAVLSDGTGDFAGVKAAPVTAVRLTIADDGTITITSTGAAGTGEFCTDG
jgi:hypothetical protein